MHSAGLLAALTALASVALAAPAPTCTGRRYLDVSSGTCKTCPINFFACTSPTDPISCSRGYFMTIGKQCVKHTECPDGTFPDLPNRACKKCPSPYALTCSNGDAQGTTSCKAGMCLLAGRCISDKRIPGGYFCQNGIASACGDGVKFCDRQTGAPTTCAAGYLKPPTGQNKCVKGTSDMFYDFLDDVYVKDCAKAATYRCDDTRCYTLTLAKHLDVYSNMCTPCQDGAHLTCDIDGFATSCLPDWHLVPYANSNSLGQDAYSFEGQGKKACIRCNGDRVWDEAQQKCTLTCAEGFRPHIGVTDYCGSCSGEGAICPAGESWMTCGIEGSNRNFYLDVPSRTCKEQIFS